MNLSSDAIDRLFDVLGKFQNYGKIKRIEKGKGS
jgi:hypothetical protein